MFYLTHLYSKKVSILKIYFNLNFNSIYRDHPGESWTLKLNCASNNLISATILQQNVFFPATVMQRKITQLDKKLFGLCTEIFFLYSSKSQNACMFFNNICQWDCKDNLLLWVCDIWYQVLLSIFKDCMMSCFL